MNPPERQSSSRSISRLAAVALGPLVICLLATAIEQYMPERSAKFDINVSLDIDLRAATLLVSGIFVAYAFFGGSGKVDSCESIKEPQSETPVAEVAEEDVYSPGESPVTFEMEAMQLPEELLQTMVIWRKESNYPRLLCPVCRNPMMKPLRLSCEHHACGRCLKQLRADGFHTCPQCNASANIQAPLPADQGLLDRLAAAPCVCAACHRFEGSFLAVCGHITGCTAANLLVTLRNCRFLAEVQERWKQFDLERFVASFQKSMAGASPALVQRIPASAVGDCSAEAQWASPVFTACGQLWSLRMGTLGGGAPGTQFFCLLPHGHDERLKCSIFFAKRNGQGFKERRIHDWPMDLAGQPWGPTLDANELAKYKQEDGSVLIMVHADSLCGYADLQDFSATPPLRMTPR